MTTETDICNICLDVLKERALTSYTEDTSLGRWFRRNFPLSRDAVLKRYEWVNAMERASIPASVTAPAFGWQYKYAEPVNCLRVLPLTHNGEINGQRIAHEIEGGFVLTDQTGPLKVRYIKKTEDYDRYPAELIETIGYRMAGRMAHWLTGKSSYAEIAFNLYRGSLDDGWATNAIQGTHPEPQADEFLSVR